MVDAEPTAGFDRVIENGRIIRIETDGNGGLVEHDEGPVTDQVYATTKAELKSDRAYIAQVDKLRNDAAMTTPDRHKAVLRIVRDRGEVTVLDISKQLTCWNSEVATSLLSLRRRGLVDYDRQSKPGPLWYAVAS